MSRGQLEKRDRGTNVNHKNLLHPMMHKGAQLSVPRLSLRESPSTDEEGEMTRKCSETQSPIRPTSHPSVSRRPTLEPAETFGRVTLHPQWCLRRSHYPSGSLDN